MTHFFVLGLEVALEGGFGGDGGGDSLGDADAGGLEGSDLFGVVGDEADGGDVESLEDFGGELEAAVVGAEAELLIGFDGVEALVLELVGAELGHEADAAAFLVLVEEYAGALLGDEAEGKVELVVAVTTEGVKDVSGEALGVDADERGRGLEVADGKGYGGVDALETCGGGFGDGFKAEDAEVSPTGGEVGVSYFTDVVVLHGISIDSRREGKIHAMKARGKRGESIVRAIGAEVTYVEYRNKM
jgi:hypothetical protein